MNKLNIFLNKHNTIIVLYSGVNAKCIDNNMYKNYFCSLVESRSYPLSEKIVGPQEQGATANEDGLWNS